ncbi:aldo/keto reductase [Gammaproteobacteria bacterium]|nr:aldo/keto reductase [Gammaproteobacteria bacterium]
MIDKLCVGSAQFGLNYGINNSQGMVSKEELCKVLSLSLENNINMIDTAHAYGQSEKRLGNNDLSRWNIVTKIPTLNEESYQLGEVNKFVESSLVNMNIDHLYGVLIHDTKNFLDHPKYKTIFSELIDLKKSKVVNKIGLSIYDPTILKRFSKEDLQHFDIVQCPFSIADQRILDSDEIVFLKTLGAEIHARSIFLQGLLLMDPKSRPSKFYNFKKWFDCYDEYLYLSGYSQLEACLKFVLHTSLFDRVIIGLDCVDQLSQILNLNFEEEFIPPEQLDCNSIDLIDPVRWSIND